MDNWLYKYTARKPSAVSFAVMTAHWFLSSSVVDLPSKVDSQWLACPLSGSISPGFQWPTSVMNRLLVTLTTIKGQITSHICQCIWLADVAKLRPNRQQKLFSTDKHKKMQIADFMSVNIDCCRASLAFLPIARLSTRSRALIKAWWMFSCKYQ